MRSQLKLQGFEDTHQTPPPNYPIHAMSHRQIPRTSQASKLATDPWSVFPINEIFDVSQEVEPRMFRTRSPIVGPRAGSSDVQQRPVGPTE